MRACVVHTGTLRDAILFSFGCNSEHGLRRTNQDKRNAVTKMLGDSEWSKWSNAEIAKRCVVSAQFVGIVRSSLETVYSEKPPTERVVKTKHGTTTTMDTSKIGKTKPETTAPTVAKAAGIDPETERVKQLLGAGRPTGGTKFDPVELEALATEEPTEDETNATPHLDGVAETLPVFRGAINDAGRLREKIRGLTELKGGAKLAKYWSDIERCLDQVRVYLKAYRFWANCPECKIESAKSKPVKTCKLCNGHGWIAKTNGLSVEHKLFLTKQGVEL